MFYLCKFIFGTCVLCVVIAAKDYCDKEDGCDDALKDKQSVLLQKDPDIHFTNSLSSRLNQIVDTNKLPPLSDPLYLLEDDQLPTIIWWYGDIYPHGSTKNIKCSLGSCKVTEDKKELNDHKTRGFIFYGTSFYANDLPLPRLPHHEWALFHEESPKNNWMFSSDLGISLFNHTATFRRESDYPLSTQFIRDPDEWFDNTYYVNTDEKNRLQKEEGLSPLVYVQRDCNPPSDRDTYVEELMKYILIDSYGKCLNNKKMPQEIDGFHKLSSESYFRFLAKYKFQIAFENSICQDYMTEKVFRPLKIGSVPVYLGSPSIRDFMPSDKAVIIATDFDSPKDLANYLKELNENDTKYEEYLKHRKIGKITNPEFQKALKRQKWSISHKKEKINFGYLMFSTFSCYLCDELHERNNMLKSHLKDGSKLVKPNKMANSSHMGCPRPSNILPSSKKRDYIVYDYGSKEAKALEHMLLANETESKNWKSYLNAKTDKYPE